jgi:hypothetical protein
MDIPWDEYKPLLRRAYFGDHEGAIATKESDMYKDFWMFHKKYVRVVYLIVNFISTDTSMQQLRNK